MSEMFFSLLLLFSMIMIIVNLFYMTDPDFRKENFLDKFFFTISELLRVRQSKKIRDIDYKERLNNLKKSATKDDLSVLTIALEKSFFDKIFCKFKIHVFKEDEINPYAFLRYLDYKKIKYKIIFDKKNPPWYVDVNSMNHGFMNLFRPDLTVKISSKYMKLFKK